MDFISGATQVISVMEHATGILPSVTKKSKEKYRSHANQDEKAGEADRTGKQNSLEAVELQTGDTHGRPSAIRLVESRT